MDYVILDLEWNGVYSRRKKKNINEIIDMGAVRLNADTLKVVDRYSMLITPQIGKKLNKHVQELTHISIDELESARHTFTHALSRFNSFSDGCVILTWGTTDILTMMSNCEYFLHDNRPPFLKYYIDLQAYCQSAISMSNPGRQLGLVAVAEMLGIKYEEREMHRALADSELAAKCFKALYNAESVAEYLNSADSEFYKRMTFKNHYITDIDSEDIDKNELYDFCGKCGCKMQVKSRWQSKNRGFRARTVCPNCKVPSYTIVRFKRKFDHVEIKRFTAPVGEDTEKNSANEHSVVTDSD